MLYILVLVKSEKKQGSLLFKAFQVNMACPSHGRIQSTSTPKLIGENTQKLKVSNLNRLSPMADQNWSLRTQHQFSSYKPFIPQACLETPIPHTLDFYRVFIGEMPIRNGYKYGTQSSYLIRTSRNAFWMLSAYLSKINEFSLKLLWGVFTKIL